MAQPLQKMLAEMNGRKDMNVRQNRQSIRFPGLGRLASGIPQLGKRAGAALVARWTRVTQALERTLNEMAAASERRVDTLKSQASGNSGRSPFVRIGTTTRASRKAQPLFVPVSSFEFESFSVTVRRFECHERPQSGNFLSKSTKAAVRSPYRQPALPTL